MFAFIDESGNSGTNLFDASQPYFYSLAMTCDFNFDSMSKERMNTIRKFLKCDELHANELGLSRINSVSTDILKIIKKYRLKFCFVTIEKSYVSLVRLFDCIFDPYENVAVPWTAYNAGPLRCILLVKFSEIVDERIVVDFWNNCMMEKNNQNATSSFLSICKVLSLKAKHIDDRRLKKIITDAINWAEKYPGEIVFSFDEKRSRLMGAANFVAFTMIIPKLCECATKWSTSITSIVHDEQGQFKNIFEYYYQISKKSKKISFPKYFGFGDLDFSPLNQCKFSMNSSNSSNGLQLVDVILYLLKKSHTGLSIEGKAGKLLRYINTKSELGEYTFQAMLERASQEYLFIMNRPCSEDEMQKGREFQALVEDRRIAAMKEFEAKNSLHTG